MFCCNEIWSWVLCSNSIGRGTTSMCSCFSILVILYYYLVYPVEDRRVCPCFATICHYLPCDDGGIPG